MCTGRITEIGTVIETGSRLVVEAPKTAAGLAVGGSVNANGTCLSAAHVVIAGLRTAVRRRDVYGNRRRGW